jgi:hypothetical protein
MKDRNEERKVTLMEMYKAASIKPEEISRGDVFTQLNLLLNSYSEFLRYLQLERTGKWLN